MYVITFRQKTPAFEGSGELHASRFEGKIYIAAGSYAVRKIEIRTEAPVQNRQGRGLAAGKRDPLLLKDVKTEFTISYRSGFPEQISMNKHYLFQGNMVAEQTRLTFTGKQPLSPEVAIRRDYFLD